MFASLSLAALLVSPITLTSAAAVPLQPRGAPLQLRSLVPRAFADATPDQPTQKYQELQRSTSGKSPSSAALRAARAANSTDSSDSAPLDNAGDVEYLVPIQWGSQSFNVILDTGSSDTWLASSSFQCIDANGNSQAQSQCDFGPLFQGDFGSNKIDGVNFNISYGDGEYVNGDMGYENVTIAGITVPKQEVIWCQSWTFGDF
jgi:hypothetical protein